MKNDKLFKIDDSTDYKKKKTINCKIITILLICVLVIAGYIVLITLTINRPSKNKSKSECYVAHEGYDLTETFPQDEYTKFAVAVDSARCSTIGKEILLKNGSAVDAAIAAGLCNSLYSAHSMSIGGGHFMTIFLKENNTVYTINAREMAPLNSYADMFINRSELLLIGGLASGIPGEIKGYYEAYKIGGKLPWRDLFQPTIELCENGIKITASLAGALRSRSNQFRPGSGLDQTFIDPLTNQHYKENDTVFFKNLANTLRIIADSGSDQPFYNGELTSQIVKEMNDNGGNVTLQDFINYKAEVEKDRLIIKLDDEYKMIVPPAPSSAMIMSYIIRIMKEFNFINDKMSTKNLKLYYHRLLESFKHAFAKRARLGDEKFVNITKVTDDLLNEEKIKETVNKISDKKTYPSSYYSTTATKSDHGTAHLSVLAPNGDAVALTSTINTYFGAKYQGLKTGIIFNNNMDDFSTPGVTNFFGLSPSEENFIAPGKRPLSSMSPTIILDKNNDVKLILGSSGGSKILTAVSQVIIKVLWMKESLKKAIDDRRAHHQLYPEEAELENEFPQVYEEYLSGLGHKIKCFNFGGSSIQAILVNDDKKISAYSDPRKGGKPDGI